MGSVLGGTHLVYHAAGWMEGGLQASYEKFVLDVELLQHMMEFLRPLTWLRTNCVRRHDPCSNRWAFLR